MIDSLSTLNNHQDMLTMEDIQVEPPAGDQPFDPRHLFAKPLPVEMEIGCGKGGFLLQRARAFPDRNFFAVEWANKFYRYAADRMARWEVRNVRILRTDAGQLVVRQLVPHCLSALHLYHPDPWPKKRHHKRRLVQLPFVDAVALAMVPNGMWWIQTDHAEYYAWIRAIIDPHPQFLEVPFESDRNDGADPQTNFQVKYLREGRGIYRVAYRRSPNSTIGEGRGDP